MPELSPSPSNSSLPSRPDVGPRIGIALGGGSARGWAHIGVLRVLEQAGISPHIVCGTSAGALVGAVYAAGELELFESWVKSLTWQGVVRLLDLSFSGGLISGAKLLGFLRSKFADPEIGELSKTFAAVATELATGREVWLQEGSLIESVRASIALPGMFTPALRDGRLLVDGGLVNPVPVSLCRALGAEIVIAVDLNRDLVGDYARSQREAAPVVEEPNGVLATLWSKLAFEPNRDEESKVGLPSMLDVLTTSVNIMQSRITRSRLAGEPADVLIRPRLANVRSVDYHRAAIAIDEGQRAAEFALAEIKDLIG